MSYLQRVFVPLLLFVFSGLVIAEDSIIAPQEGALLLRNGSVLQGKVIRLGDRYMISIGRRAEIFIDRNEVELHCRSLQDIYLHKSRALQQSSAKEHLQLAQWCLQYRLYANAEEQLKIALKMAPQDPGISAIRRQLEFATRPVAPLRSKNIEKSSPFITMDQIESELVAIPARVIERFTISVQPILLNRCSNAGCHGLRSTSSYQLVRPAKDIAISRRITQRNLFSTLQMIDYEDPSSSPLLTNPREAHGTAQKTIFSQRDHRQYEQLLAWVHQLTQAKKAPDSTASARPNSVRLQSTGTPFPVLSLKTFSPERKSFSTTRQGDDWNSSLLPPMTAPGNGFVPKDPFDPEVFNRRYHAADNQSSDVGKTENRPIKEPSSADGGA